ncbi:MAG: hypothetical protein V7K97_02010 [Nostoc sp.]|uniref:hypothetical protein n=1 Tax=Nostoc sp. TaxID=1180 RepID=UPI002FF49A15
MSRIKFTQFIGVGVSRTFSYREAVNGEEGRRQEAEILEWVLNPRRVWSRQEIEGSFPPASCPLSPAFIDKWSDRIN